MPGDVRRPGAWQARSVPALLRQDGPAGAASTVGCCEQGPYGLRDPAACLPWAFRMWPGWHPRSHISLCAADPGGEAETWVFPRVLSTGSCWPACPLQVPLPTRLPGSRSCGCPVADPSGQASLKPCHWAPAGGQFLGTRDSPGGGSAQKRTRPAGHLQDRALSGEKVLSHPAGV